MAVVSWQDVVDEEDGVIGDPIAHSWSPLLFDAAFAASERKCRYIRIHCLEPEFEDAIAALRTRMKGLNITAPFKGRVRPALGHESSMSCNAVSFEGVGQCESFDGAGLIAALNELKLGGRVLIIGAGGAAQAACNELAKNQEVYNWNRLGKRLASAIPAQPEVQGFDIVINATGACPELEWTGTGSVYDLSYSATPTPFMVEAIRYGWDAYDGRLMLLYQAALTYEFWFHQPAPLEAMREALP